MIVPESRLDPQLPAEQTLAEGFSPLSFSPWSNLSTFFIVWATVLWAFLRPLDDFRPVRTVVSKIFGRERIRYAERCVLKVLYMNWRDRINQVC